MSVFIIRGRNLFLAYSAEFKGSNQTSLGFRTRRLGGAGEKICGEISSAIICSFAIWSLLRAILDVEFIS